MDRPSATGKRKAGARNPRPPRQKSGSSKVAAGGRDGRVARRLTAAQQAIGNFLRATRTAQKLTQEQVSDMTRGSPWQLSRAAISAIERGQNFPGMEAMLALAHVLYVDPKELVERARVSTTVPVDVTDLGWDELDRRGSQYFWAGDFRKALAVYDAMLERLALEPGLDDAERRRRLASLEIRRATALKRTGALSSATACAERAVTFGAAERAIQAEAYVVLADLQVQRGHLPLAADASQRAIALAEGGEARTLGWAWMVRARSLFLAGEYEDARVAFLEARKHALASGDQKHRTHVEGNVGMCWLAMGKSAEARKWVMRAVDLARQQAQPALEASWLVELGKIALHDGDPEEADSYAQAALRIAKPREHFLTIFRAEWLRHRAALVARPGTNDRHRIAFLRKLFLQLDQHEGIEEIGAFRAAVLETRPGDDGGAS